MFQLFIPAKASFLFPSSLFYSRLCNSPGMLAGNELPQRETVSLTEACCDIVVVCQWRRIEGNGRRIEQWLRKTLLPITDIVYKM